MAEPFPGRTIFGIGFNDRKDDDASNDLLLRIDAGAATQSGMFASEGEDIVTATELIDAAKGVLGEFTLSNDYFRAGNVAAALLSRKGHVYTGICIDVACGIGFCAEHSAIAEMLKHRETQIEMVVAVSGSKVLPPCGRCRELMFQINHGNLDAKVVVSANEIVTLNELLPHTFH